MQDIPLLLHSVTLFISHTIGPTDLLHPSPVTNFKIFQVFLIYFPKCPGLNTALRYAPNVNSYAGFFLKFESNLLVKIFILLNATFAVEILYLISRVHRAQFVFMLTTKLKCTTFPSCWPFIIRTGGRLP